MIERAKSCDNVMLGATNKVKDTGNWKPHWKIEKYNHSNELYAIDEFDGNCLLIEGISEFMKVACGIAGSTAFNTANAHIGVGNGTAPAVNTQTGLQGANKAYAIMDATYPQVSNNTVTFRATFGAGTAAFRWEEFTVANGNSDSAKNLSRKVEFHGEKASADTWVISCAITIT